MDPPSSLSRDISPPRAFKRRKTSRILSYRSPNEPHYNTNVDPDPALAAVEAGRAKIEDHLTYFEHYLTKASRSTTLDFPRLSTGNFSSLYKNNKHRHGHHFVIHQHNHPKAGVHYDLRLQFSATSSVFWALLKGFPGNPNSMQLGRTAIETRVHNLWNNLVESASMKTGSLLIWDTGTYSLLPRKKNAKAIPSPQTTDAESDAAESRNGGSKDGTHENEILIKAFDSRHIRLRLHGTRLPKDYTVTLRLPSSNEVYKKSVAKRRKLKPAARSRRPSHTSDSDLDFMPNLSSDPQQIATAETASTVHLDHDLDIPDLDTDSDEDALTRTQNAYPGPHNTIGSVHQRRWFLLLDRQSIGFESIGGKWTRRPLPSRELGGFEPFVVRGRDAERSVATDRSTRGCRVR
ncbi:uncharacterized protein EKO05_0004120 [Ascochyta rabiei]|uniref:Uncharacterized protein n=1 Tax=Didymella rabiei TaxID=5454 RepID=A0A162Y809_DIDRA|nr:uncharacterized protein EKO05_0004120 [Ascochyta rabiei]KZM19865.1 hypothetical protein ST47_g9198 [Ascochyta rabiei]UPX13619.1 hypothetical protein EKO05_0004120 [Ascochyta rabiei]